MTKEMAIARWHMLGELPCYSCVHNKLHRGCVLLAGKECYEWHKMGIVGTPLLKWEPDDA